MYCILALGLRITVFTLLRGLLNKKFSETLAHTSAALKMEVVCFCGILIAISKTKYHNVKNNFDRNLHETKTEFINFVNKLFTS
jgi:hypothetical protein